MNLDEWYFDWLLTKAGVDKDPSGFSSLCWILFDTPFLPVVEMDENRWEDGVEYRREFSEIYQGGRDCAEELDDLLGGCTMLELILSLAEKIRFEMADSIFEAGTGKWFEELLENLGLHNYTNLCIIMHENAYDEIQEILEKLNLRKYRANGEGGLFPLRQYVIDQRGVELAAQLNNYLADRYDIL